MLIINESNFYLRNAILVKTRSLGIFTRRNPPIIIQKFSNYVTFYLIKRTDKFFYDYATQDMLEK